MDRNSMVVDLSHWNVRSYEEAPKMGIRGVIHKATEGTGFIDDMAPSRYKLAHDVGLLWGLYHFIRPGDPAEQADHFLTDGEEMGILDDKTLIAVDYEDPAVSLDSVERCLGQLELQLGRSPVLYSGHVLKEKGGADTQPGLKKYRLWLAQYSDEPELPPGYDRYWLWQWSDKGVVPYIEPPTDLNHFPESEDVLRIDWAGA